LTGETRQGFKCSKFDAGDEKFAKAYDWQFCKNMEVGQMYEVHWPNSAGACGSSFQYQTPFQGGDFCGTITQTQFQIGVQAKIFTIVNDESF
jgi:hypothetical protein